jgi:hypothetical protein
LLLVGLTVANLGSSAPRAPFTPAPVRPSIAKSSTAPSASSLSERVEIALQSLSPYVKRQSDANALRTALHAYYAYQAARGQSNNPYFYFVDYGLDGQTPRGYVFDMRQLTLIDGPFMVAHGRGSSNGKYGVPTRFTNSAGSSSTSLGLYRAGETYGFTGHSGGRTYGSIGLRLDGLSGKFNSSARSRGVVAHGAPYINASGAGRSQGCPAMEQQRARKLLPMLANGALVFLYSPRDTGWLQQDPWANAAD